MPPEALGLTAAAVGLLGVPQGPLKQQWLAHLLPAIAAAADRAAGTTAAAAGDGGGSGGSGSSVDGNEWVWEANTAAAAAAGKMTAPAAAAAVELPCSTIVALLQSLVLLRVRPPAPLLSSILAVVKRDMLLAGGPVLVGLLLLLAQLRYRPGPDWVRVVLLRLQGRLRMLGFEQLTQVGGSYYGRPKIGFLDCCVTTGMVSCS
jgi:hypothetical protein